MDVHAKGVLGRAIMSQPSDFAFETRGELARYLAEVTWNHRGRFRWVGGPNLADAAQSRPIAGLSRAGPSSAAMIFARSAGPLSHKFAEPAVPSFVPSSRDC